MSLFFFLLTLLAFPSGLFSTSDSCNYVVFTSKSVITQENYGKSVVATDTCQGVKAPITQLIGPDITLSSSYMFICQNKSDEVLAMVYDDTKCKRLRDTKNVRKDKSIKILNDQIKLTIKSVVCHNDTSSKMDNPNMCYVGWSFGDINCNWNKGASYFNNSFPLDQCLVVEEDKENDREASNTIYNCCEEDNSLLIKGHFDTQCNNVKNITRIPASYNTMCHTYSNDVKDGTYQLLWKCNSDIAISCDSLGYEYVNESILPPQCEAQCIPGIVPNGETQNPTIFNSLAPIFSPTMDPTKYPSNYPTNTPKKNSKINGNSSSNSGISEMMIVLILCVILSSVLLFMIIYFNRKKKAKLQNEIAIADEIVSSEEEGKKSVVVSAAVVGNMSVNSGNYEQIDEDKEGCIDDRFEE